MKRRTSLTVGSQAFSEPDSDADLVAARTQPERHSDYGPPFGFTGHIDWVMLERTAQPEPESTTAPVLADD